MQHSISSAHTGLRSLASARRQPHPGAAEQQPPSKAAQRSSLGLPAYTVATVRLYNLLHQRSRHKPLVLPRSLSYHSRRQRTQTAAQQPPDAPGATPAAAVRLALSTKNPTALPFVSVVIAVCFPLPGDQGLVVSAAKLVTVAPSRAPQEVDLGLDPREPPARCSQGASLLCLLWEDHMDLSVFGGERRRDLRTGVRKTSKGPDRLFGLIPSQSRCRWLMLGPAGAADEPAVGTLERGYIYLDSRAQQEKQDNHAVIRLARAGRGGKWPPNAIGAVSASVRFQRWPADPRAAPEAAAPRPEQQHGGSVLFHYLPQDGQTRKLHSEVTQGWSCPMCAIKCNSLRGLSSHLKSSHDLFHYTLEERTSAKMPEVWVKCYKYIVSSMSLTSSLRFPISGAVIYQDTASKEFTFARRNGAVLRALAKHAREADASRRRQTRSQALPESAAAAAAAAPSPGARSVVPAAFRRGFKRTRSPNSVFDSGSETLVETEQSRQKGSQQNRGSSDLIVISDDDEVGREGLQGTSFDDNGGSLPAWPAASVASGNAAPPAAKMPKAEAVSLADYEADEEEGECTSRAPESAAGRKQPAELDKAVTSLLSLRKPPRPGLPPRVARRGEDSKALPRARAQAAPLRKGDKRHAQRMSARTYFHSKSCQVMTLAEVLGEQDSDDDYDEQECLQLNQRMLDNCAANPTPTEREFMLLWNMYLAKFPVHSDALTPAKCEEFAAHHAAELSRPEMRRSFVMHLVNLFKFGLLAASSVTRCLQVVDSGTTPPE